MVAEPFSRVLAIDFSANSTPKFGADSIWVATADAARVRDVRNLPTRHALAEFIAKVADAPGRTLLVVDVALGWPEGLAALITPERPDRAGVVSLLAELVVDDATNANNRFEVANELNRRAGVAALWGHPHGRTYEWLSPTKKPPACLAPWTGHHLRRLERVCGGTIKSPLQLYGNGSVGSQSLLAQAMFERLRRRGVDLAIWPFESPDGARLVVVEEFFNRPLFKLRDASCRDEAQVRAVASLFARDLRAGVNPLAPSQLDALARDVRRVVDTEEGWLARLAVPAQ